MLSPGIAFAVWTWSSLDPLINILAAVGLETLFLLVFVFVSITIQAYRIDKADKEAEAGEEPNGKTSAEVEK